MKGGNTVEAVQIVGSARTASAAIRGIQCLSPDLVILNFQMPDGMGIDVLKTIRQGTAPPLVMMLTNVAYPQYRIECRQRGRIIFLISQRSLSKSSRSADSCPLKRR